jgi:organic hydroperoxide reductase OsmC/OhrA
MAETTVHVRTVHDANFSVGWAGKHSLTIDRPEQEAGSGYGFSGADLLLLALSACYVNDLQQEADRRGIKLLGVRAVCECDWGGAPVRAQNLSMSVRIEAQAGEDEILELAESIDRRNRVANTLRLGVELPESECEVFSVEVEQEAG